MNPGSALVWAIVSAVIATFAAFLDPLVTLSIQRSISTELDAIFDTLSGIANANVIATVALLTYLTAIVAHWVGRRTPAVPRIDDLARGSMLLMATLLTGGVIVWMLKQLVARARPAMLIERERYGLGAALTGAPFDSFPSSHAFTAWAVAAVALRVAPALRIPAMALAVFVSAARVLTLEHFVSDVMASAVIAFGACAFWTRRVLGRAAPWPLSAR